MDLSTVIGVVCGGGFILWGLSEGNLISIFANMHGLTIVLGGTLSAIFINTPFRYVKEAVRAAFSIFTKEKRDDLDKIIDILVRLSEQAKTRGVFSLQLDENEKKICGGFLARAIQLSKEQNNPEFVQMVLEHEIAQTAERHREIVNVFRTMSILSPMFGLVGTLIGIIQVLKELSNPDAVGVSMALAITSAFYGILLANLVFVPMAGKLRIRSLEENREKEMIMEGIVEILRGSIPLMIMRKLVPYLIGIRKNGKKGGLKSGVSEKTGTV